MIDCNITVESINVETEIDISGGIFFIAKIKIRIASRVPKPNTVIGI